MEIKHYFKQVDNVFAESRLLKFLFLVMAVVTVLNYQTAKNATNDRRTVVIPLVASGEIWVTGNTVSEDYLVAMARIITSAVGTYTAASARKQFNEVLALIHPSRHDAVRKRLMELTEEIKKFPSVSSMVTWVGGNPVEKTSDKIIVHALKSRIVNGDTTRTEKRKFIIEYKVENGRFWVMNLGETSDD